MKVGSDHHISGSFGTDEQSALKTVKSNEKQSVDSVAEKFTKDSTAKPSAKTSTRSELQHKVLGHEVKNELSHFSQVKAAELTSKLNNSTHTTSEEKPSLLDRAKQTATEIGEKVSDAGTKFQQAADTLKDSHFAPNVSRLAEKANDLGKKISESPEIIFDHDNPIRKEIDSATQQGKEILARGGEAIKGKAEELIGKGVEQLEQSKKDINKLDENMDPEKGVDQLKNEGDKYTVNLGAGVGATVGGFPLKGSLKGNAEISKEKDGYKLTVDGEAAAAITKDKVGDLGQTGGMKVELTFKTAEEAKQAIRNLKQAVNVPDNPYQAGGLTVNKKSIHELSKHVKSIEVRSGVFAQGVLEGSGKVGGADMKTLFAKGQVKADGAVRLEFENGKPSKLVVKASAQGEGAVGSGWKIGRGGVELNTGIEASVSQKVTITAEHEIPLSANVDPKKMLEAIKSGDPNQLKSADPEAFRKWKEQNKFVLTVSGDVKNDRGGTGEGIQQEVKISVSAQYFKKNGQAIQELVNNGPTPQNIESLGDDVEIEGKSQTYKYTGAKWTPGIKVGQSEAGIEMGYSKQEITKTKSFSKEKRTSTPQEERKAG